METIIKNWDHPYIGIVFFQNDQTTFESIQELLRKKKFVIDHCCISLFRKYNNKIIQQHGSIVYMEGLINLMEYILCDMEDIEFVKTWGTPDFIVKKSYMSEKNRILLLEANQRLN